MEKTKLSQDVHHIREMMEKSSKFLSLSGLSGVFAGVIALLGLYFINQVLNYHNLEYALLSGPLPQGVKLEVGFYGFLMVLFSLVGAYILSLRKSSQSKTSLKNPASRRLLKAFTVPFLLGALVTIGLLINDFPILVAPSTLLFYGIALFYAGHFTYKELSHLGILIAATGSLAFFLPQFGFYLWGFGFGILHILYGSYMHYKYR